MWISKFLAIFTKNLEAIRKSLGLLVTLLLTINMV